MDFVLLAVFAVLIKVTNGMQMKITAAAFCVTVVFAYSPAYHILVAADQAYDIAFMYGVLLLPFIFISNENGASALGLYAMAQGAVALDYIFYPSGGSFIDNYYDTIHNTLDLCLILLSLEGGYNVDRVVRNFKILAFSLFSIQGPKTCSPKQGNLQC